MLSTHTSLGTFMFTFVGTYLDIAVVGHIFSPVLFSTIHSSCVQSCIHTHVYFHMHVYICTYIYTCVCMYVRYAGIHIPALSGVLVLNSVVQVGASTGQQPRQAACLYMYVCMYVCIYVSFFCFLQFKLFRFLFLGNHNLTFLTISTTSVADTGFCSIVCMCVCVFVCECERAQCYR